MLTAIPRRCRLLGLLAILCVLAGPIARGDESAAPATAATGDRDLSGFWSGTLNAGVELRLVFHVKRDKAGAYQATLDSPDQGATGIPIAKFTLEGSQVVADVKVAASSFAGTLSDDGKTIDGNWKQAGQTFPLKLARAAKAPEVNRPQNPKKPYPYREEEVTIENRAAKIKLAGTLTLPETSQAVPAVVLLSGSGPQDRNEELLGHRPFLVLADYLTRRGIAVLRCDDRGVGGSEGNTLKATTPDLAADAIAAIEYLKTRNEIDPKHIGLIGHSEGGLVAPMAATLSSDVAFIVLMAGTGVPGDEILDRQGELIARASGADEKTIAEQRAAQQKIFPLIKSEQDPKKLEEQLRTVLEPLYRTDEEKAAAAANLKVVLTPWFRYFIAYDPRPVLRKVKCPVLAIVGEKDVQVDPEQNMPQIEKALQEAGNSDVTLRIFPGLNHLFQHCENGGLAEYGKIEETLSPEVLAVIAEWIRQRAK